MKIQKNISLKNKNTFGLGGKAKYFAKISNLQELKQIIKFANLKKLPLIIIGEGSNLLFSDKDLSAVVIKLNNQSHKIAPKSKNTYIVSAGAGLNWDRLVNITVKNQLQGIECLSAIPGTVGAAPVQNIGAYGQELKDNFLSLTAIHIPTLKKRIFAKKDCHFDYRYSIFKNPSFSNQFIVWQVSLLLKKNSPPQISYDSLKTYLDQKNISNPTLRQVRQAIINIRQSKLEDPKINGNAGSFFKNPIISQQKIQQIQKKYPDMPFLSLSKNKYKLFAAWLIQQSGFRGKKYHQVGVSDKNSLVLINYKHKGKAQDILVLSKQIQKQVKSKFDILLEPEVQYIQS